VQLARTAILATPVILVCKATKAIKVTLAVKLKDLKEMQDHLVIQVIVVSKVRKVVA
jgi:hypothetical protein